MNMQIREDVMLFCSLNYFEFYRLDLRDRDGWQKSHWDE